MAVSVPQSIIEPRDRVVDALVDVLEAERITHVYGVPGGAIAPIYDALVDRSFRVVHVRHETSALFMALGHTRMRLESMPCVLTTSGPGVTNALTGLASAAAERVPVLVLSGEVPRSKFGRGALQEGSPDAMDVVGMVRNVTRLAERVTSSERAVHQLRNAIARARRERGPVLLSMPFDLALRNAHEAHLARIALPSPIVDDEAIALAARAIERAKSPLLLLGSDARRAAPEIRKLVERLGLPVITSPSAKGVVSERSPLCLGVFGYAGHPSARRFLERVRPDVVLAIGCELDEVSTNSWSPLLQAELMIQVDEDSSRFGKNYRADITIEGPCDTIVRRLDQRVAGARAATVQGIDRLDPQDAELSRVPIHPARVIQVLQEELPDDTVYAADIGEHLLFALHYLRLEHADQLLVALGLGSMGSGIGAAVGAKLAAPERSVAVVCGDYGFQMYGMEINTCVQEELAVVFVVMNDARMRMVEAGNRRIYGRTIDMTGPEVDFAALARAHGAHGVIVRREAELRQALRDRPDKKPMLLDCRIDRSASFTSNARIEELGNFKVSS